MKKKAILFLTVLFAIFTPSCSERANTASAVKTSIQYEEKTVEPTDSTNEKYSLKCVSYREGNNVLFYPQISGLPDSEKQEELNDTILEDAKKVFSMFGGDAVCITVDCEILSEDKEKIVINYVGQGFFAEEDEPVTVYYESVIYI